MALKKIFFTLLLLAFFSCKKDNPDQENTTDINTIRTDMIKVNNPIISLNPKAKKLVKDWGEYQKMDEFIQQYYHITISDALFNAKEFSKLSQELKDSIRVDKLDIPSVKIRLNVLNNEVLRLADMATIAHLAPSVITQENQNIFDAYFALNSKINNMVNQENLNSDVNLFIDEITNGKNSTDLNNEMKNDTSKIKKVIIKN